MKKITLGFFAGSARQESVNKKLARYASIFASGSENTEARFFDLADYPAPIYNGDAEAKGEYPEMMKKLKAELNDCHGIFVVSPEYNGFFSPLLKNVTDWLTRPVPGSALPVNLFQGKVMAIASASPGGLGGLRGLPHLRVLYAGIGADVIHEQYSLGNAYNAFDAQGKLTSPDQEKGVITLINAFIAKTRALQAV